MAFAERDLQRGIEGDEFFPVFQPLIELRTGQLTGFELLARWQPAGSSLIMPDAFIPAIENAGLINELTRIMLGKALSIQSLVSRPLMLSLNLSPAQLLDPGLPARIESMAGAANFPLDRLTVEITESALLGDLPRAIAVANELKALHCRLALDDFGTGYSSLRHLHALPFDELKVDRSFVSSMVERRESRKIVASVIGLGQGLGLMTVAEGIESREQAEMLFWLGCDLGQGWLFGKPVPAAELDPILNRDPRECIVASPAQHDGASLLTHAPIPAHRVAQLQAIYDGAPVGLCFLDRDFRYVNLNRQLAQMNGVPAAAHIGRAVAEVIPHVFPIVEPFLRRALAGESLTGVEIAKPPHNGAPAQSLVVSYLPVRDEAGDILGVSVAVMDVTLRKETEARLRESEEHFRHWIRLTPHVPWVLNAKGEVSEASPNWTQYTSQHLDQAMGDGWLEMLHPDDVPRAKEAVRAAVEDGQPVDVEYRVRRPDEEWKWMRSRGAPRFNATGRVICVYGIVEEIENQKQVSRELEICESELRSAINAVPVGIVIADGADAAIFMVNPCAHQTFGDGLFPGQKLPEYSRMGLLDPGGRPLSPEEYPLARAIQRGETIESRPYLLRRPSGVVAHLSISSRPIHSDEGALVGGMMLVRDPEIGS
ncbi:MAG TPA: EAL domain-containing protein [Terracidiphilus sp.]|nr:EAL domain-containing protein [Terracidiphilus sp.]